MLNKAFFVAGAAVSGGTSVITGEVKTAIVDGVANLFETVTDVVGLTTPTIIAAVALTGGVAYAIAKIRGILSWAS